jgi:hypothetical protein
MRTISKTVYSFNELSDAAKEKAINELRGANLQDTWWDFIYYDAEDVGLKITGFDLDRNRHATGSFTLSAAEVAQNVLNNHGEACGTYKAAQSFLEEYNPLFASYLDEESESYESYEAEQHLQEVEDEFLSSLLEEYSLILQKEYEYQYEDEYVLSSIESNNFEFYEDGSLF